MDLLQILLSFFGADDNSSINQEKTKDSPFDFTNFLKDFNLDGIFSFIEDFLGFKNNTCSANSAEQARGLEPISLIANEDIIYTLNLYFSKC